MQQSLSISIERDLSSVTTSIHSNENKLEKWRRLNKRIIRFFRLMKISIVRLRFIDMLVRMNIDEIESDELKTYETRKVQEDLAFLDDVKRYHEVFNSFVSVGFVWQDREFQLARLKANYIYERYMATSDAIAKTNIPIETIPTINNRLNSPRIFSSLIYLNLFNDAEKFLIEKLLLIYLRKGWKCLSMHRLKTNRTLNESFLTVDRMSKIDKSEISMESSMKLKHEHQYDEIIIPNWTYSTSQGVFYNPIIEKTVKISKKNLVKKIKNIESTIKLDTNLSNVMKPQNSITCPRFQLPSPTHSRPNHVFPQNIFVCKTHSSDRFHSKQSSPYRMISQRQIFRQQKLPR